MNQHVHTDQDLNPMQRTEGNYWKAKYFELRNELVKANRALVRLSARSKKARKDSERLDTVRRAMSIRDTENVLGQYVIAKNLDEFRAMVDKSAWTRGLATGDYIFHGTQGKDDISIVHAGNRKEDGAKYQIPEGWKVGVPEDTEGWILDGLRRKVG